MNVLFESLFEMLFPEGPQCCFCGKSLKTWETYWCAECRKEISNIDGVRCQKCARFLHEGRLCSYCSQNEYPFTSALSAGLYEGKLKEALQEFKFRGKRSLAVPLARLMALQAIRREEYLKADLIIPVPLHKKRLIQRGFNQADLLGKEVARILAKQYSNNILHKILNTKDMVGLNKKERAENLQGAFTVVNKNLIKDKSIILIDDIFTTGYTAFSCSETLLNSGAGKVFVLTVAANFDI